LNSYTTWWIPTPRWKYYEFSTLFDGLLKLRLYS
jgi:hypothetical protein